MKLLGTELTRDIERDLFDYMPKEYEEYRESRAVIQANASEYELFNENISDVLAQLFIDSATWGLSEWERFVGLPPAPDYSEWDAVNRRGVVFSDVEGQTWNYFEKAFIPNESERRSSVKARIRGTGTVTKQLLADVCDSYTGGKVEVSENAADFRIVIEFIDTVGAPENIEPLQAAINRIIPAHLTVDYVFRYLRWSELDNYSWTWDGLDAMAMTWDEFSETVGA
jgi:hypothetical protein